MCLFVFNKIVVFGYSNLSGGYASAEKALYRKEVMWIEVAEVLFALGLYTLTGN